MAQQPQIVCLTISMQDMEEPVASRSSNLCFGSMTGDGVDAGDPAASISPTPAIVKMNIEAHGDAISFAIANVSITKTIRPAANTLDMLPACQYPATLTILPIPAKMEDQQQPRTPSPLDFGNPQQYPTLSQAATFPKRTRAKHNLALQFSGAGDLSIDPDVAISSASQPRRESWASLVVGKRRIPSVPFQTPRPKPLPTLNSACSRATTVEEIKSNQITSPGLGRGPEIHADECPPVQCGEDVKVARQPNHLEIRPAVPIPKCTSPSSAPNLSLSIVSPDSDRTFLEDAITRFESNASANLRLSSRRLNVESPSFTPTQIQSGSKKHTFSSQTANAAVFTPKGISDSPAPVLSPDTENSFVNPAIVREFTPQAQNYDLNTAGATNGISGNSTGNVYDPFGMSSMGQTLPTAPYNPYSDEHTALAASSAPFYTAQSGYPPPTQPLQYHLYAPVGPDRNDLAPYQRQAHDFFLFNDIREELQKKSAAARQVLHGSSLPEVEHYHSLVPLDNPKGVSSMFSPNVSWIYKATSKKNGNTYCLRRLAGARVNSKEATAGPLAKWKRISNGSVVSVGEVFTSRDFQDNSLILIYNYHPNSKTLAEHHLVGPSGRYGKPQIQESVLWSYICQLCNALKAIHTESLAARCVNLSKIILTEKNRIRLAACMVLDVLDYDTVRSISDLQLDDLRDLGKVILSLGINNGNITNMQVAMEQFGRLNYSQELKDVVYWLVSPPQNPEQAAQKSVHELARAITGHMFDSFDDSLHATDEMTSHLHKELENGRVARLVLKLATINERPEYENDPQWSETGERYQLKLFRDYVFHQVDSNNNPVVNLGFILSCLNKLDAGTDERVYLTSRDHQTSFVVTYKELKKSVGNAFNDLIKPRMNKSTAPRGF